MNYMANCEGCGIELHNDKYKYCWDCSQQIKQKKQASGEAITDELSHINNNLYFIRRALSALLRETHGIEIVWNKTKKDFEEVKSNAP